jgi:hypothetical protein
MEGHFPFSFSSKIQRQDNQQSKRDNWIKQENDMAIRWDKLSRFGGVSRQAKS